MILVDTSAWIEYLRATGSTTDERLDGLLREEATIAVADVVAMEILAGARSHKETTQLERLLARAAPLPTRPFFDHEAAARIYRICRAAGDTPRSMIDAMIAAVAIRHDIPVLAADRDFEAMTRHTELRLV